MTRSEPAEYRSLVQVDHQRLGRIYEKTNRLALTWYVASDADALVTLRSLDSHAASGYGGGIRACRAAVSPGGLLGSGDGDGF